MELYLVQHGKSDTEENNPQRPLTEEGGVETEKMGRFLESRHIKIDIIWHSVKLRSAQTAKIISSYVSPAKVIERKDLGPMDSPEGAFEEIKNLDISLMIVGHMPFLQKLLSLLLCRCQELEFINLNNSGVICLELGESWKINWIVTPDLISKGKIRKK